jgi:photosystem II stability/assembly factor-like uncharacterized protein
MTQAGRRRQQARERAARRAKRRVVLRVGALAALVTAVALGVWWFAMRDGDTTARPIYRFETQDFHSLAFDPGNPDRLFFGHHNGLMVSDDAGRTWQVGALRGADAMQLAMPAADPRRRYAAGHDVFYASIDGGASWQPQPNNLPGLDLHTFAGSSSDPLRLYAIPVGHELFTSADGGATWQPMTAPPGAERALVSLAVDTADPLRVYAGVGGYVHESRDGGLTWETITDVPAMVLALAAGRDQPGEMFAGTVDGLYRRDGGGEWRKLPVETDGSVLAVAISPARPERVAIIDQQGNLYRSDDRGTSWNSR